MRIPGFFNRLSSVNCCTKTINGISMKLCRMVHETLNYHVKWILWPENKNIYFRFASENYHGSILLKIERKSEKYLMR